MRIGIGFDIHKLVEGRKLILGGIEVPYNRGLLGHSDADVLLHAVSDALLGAVSAGDIGEHFSDTDAQYKDICSVDILKKCFDIVNEKGYEIENIDTVIIAQEPKLAEFKKKIVCNIVRELSLNEDQVSVKASTMEKLGEIGRGEAIACHAVVLLKEK